ncbi:MAG TPA: SCO family protein [Sphingomicrobium sp.]|nr:SCO family protein [Sphingomicrobium sp.]
MIRVIRLLLWLLVLLAGAGLAYLALRPAPETQPPRGMASLGGPFTLVGADGRPFSSARLNGRPYAIFFGFTHCPDVCPTTLARMVRLRNQLGSGAEAFDILFVSVDPARDGPGEVGAYAGLFGSPVIGLTGSQAQIDQVKKQFGIFSQQAPDGAGGYTIDHTATVLLFDKSGKFDSTISPEEQDPAALAKLKRITD